jgi:dihydrofolate reductase
MDHAAWTNTRVIKENATVEIMKLKQEPGKDIALFGSSGLALSLIRENLVDEYRIITTPTALGNGKSLFNGLGVKLDLKLDKTWIFNSGNVLNYYSRAMK